MNYRVKSSTCRKSRHRQVVIRLQLIFRQQIVTLAQLSHDSLADIPARGWHGAARHADIGDLPAFFIRRRPHSDGADASADGMPLRLDHDHALELRRGFQPLVHPYPRPGHAIGASTKILYDCDFGLLLSSSL